MQNIEANGTLDALKKTLSYILEKGYREGSYLECSPLTLTISPNPSEIITEEIHTRIISIASPFSNNGWERAKRVYTTEKDKRSKPSYRKRLTRYPDKPSYIRRDLPQIDQITNISDDMAKKPGFSCLSFTVLRPADLIDKFRPGYVPCLISGDFKFRKGFLSLNTMFRTNDALSVLFADLTYLRLLQKEVLERAKIKTTSEKLLNGNIGDLSIFFSRITIPLYLKDKSGDKFSGRDLARKMVTELEALTR